MTSANHRRRRLPVPTTTRWQPLRSGLLNLYKFDDEEFWFESGRLLLRGNNGTGKSRVLALQLPFLLDGDVSPHRLEPDGEGTRVAVDTDLMITGRVAQFGRGVLADVSSKLLDQFVACLQVKLAGGAVPGGPAPGPSTPHEVSPKAASAEAGPIRGGTVPGAGAAPAEPVDLLGTAGVPVAKRLLPVVVALVLALWFLRRRRSHAG